MGVDRRVCAVRRPVAVRRRAPRAVACARVAAALQFGVRISASPQRSVRAARAAPGPRGRRRVGVVSRRWGHVRRCRVGLAVRAGRAPRAGGRNDVRRQAAPGPRGGSRKSNFPKTGAGVAVWAAAGRAAGAGAGASGDREARRERNRPANPGNGEPNPGDAEGGFRLREARSSRSSSPCASGS